ncbi:MAG: ABC transporter permease subunit [Planctomycetota bacterium]|nr:ABC transporter permease subunit [Planctomycetota bacterium]
MNPITKNITGAFTFLQDYTLFAFELSPRLTSWLTPLWLIGVGCILGLILIGFSWLLSKGLSRWSMLNELAESPMKAAVVTAVAAIVLCGLSAPLVLGAESMPSAGVSEQTIGDIIAAFAGVFVAAWFLSYALVILAWKRTSREFKMVLREGVLYPILIIVALMASIGVVGSFVTPDPAGVIRAAVQLPFTGTYGFRFTAKAGDTAELSRSEHALDIKAGEVAAMEVTTTENVKLSFTPFNELPEEVVLEEITSEDVHRVNPFDSGLLQTIPLVDPEDPNSGRTTSINKIFIENSGLADAEVGFFVRTGTGYSESVCIPITAFSILGIFLFYLVQRMAAPRLFAVALSTYKSEVAQPLFMLIVVGGVIALCGFVWIPYNTFGEDIKMLKDAGLTLILILSIVLALWSASTSVADEIEGRTALTVLSKPLSRRSFVIGKFSGIVWMLALVYIIFGIVFIAAVAYKPLYDATETSTGVPGWQVCFIEAIRLVPGLVLGFMEAIIIASLSVAISTRLPLMANMTICMVIYALGHLTPLVVQSSLSGFAIVEFFGKLVATVFPNLDHFNIQAAISAGVDVPVDYLGWAFCYCAIYSLIAMLLALVMFEDRDLA